MKERTYNILTKLPIVSDVMILTDNTRMPFSGLGYAKVPDVAIKWMKDHPGEVLTIKTYKKLMGW